MTMNNESQTAHPNSKRPFRSSLLAKHPTFAVAFILASLAMVHWGWVASDRFVSEAHIIIQKTSLNSGQTMDFSSFLGGLGNSSADQYMLRDHLLSTDMLIKLDEKLDLSTHYSASEHDLLSRMWSDDLPLEKFHRYYLSRVSVDLDGETGLLVVKAQAYSPEMAYKIASMLVAEGERYMNLLAHNLAEDQVAFLDQQVARLEGRVMQTRLSLLEFQNSKRLVSPQGTAEGLGVIINRLEEKLAELQTTLSAKQAYLMPDSSDVVETKMQIKATEKQISREKSRLVSSSGEALNKTVEEYQRLQMEAEFALDVYKVALAALEKGRIDAIRTIKMVSVLQQPTLPQYPLEPRRLYNSVVFLLITLLIAGIVQMLIAIIHDHKE